MLHYPKIPGSKNCPNDRCLAFVKYDGTNMHFDWDRDFGWHAFGTRRDSFNLTPQGITEFNTAHTQLSECADVFEATLATPLEQLFQQPPFDEADEIKVFAEFFGPNSFAGLHKQNDSKELRLFDAMLPGEVFLDPWEFVKHCRHLPSAEVVYEGKLTGNFAEDVRQGRYPVTEGVVCKGGSRENLWMVKIKTNSYMQRLQDAFEQRWEDYWE